jgi:uncharacterized membrane protein YeaQ/YmgE (transglycosylase-associated protein family)
MNPFIWCAVGAITGWIASTVMPVPGLASRIETVLVGVFGAFIGGEFVSTLVGTPAPATVFRPAALGLAFGGALALLALLAVFRQAVGPLRPHKVPKKRTY